MTYIVSISFFTWLIIVAFADNFKMSQAKESKLAGAIHAVRTATLRSFPESVVRIEPRFGENLRLYISRNHFEVVPYPDRNRVVAQIGEVWCSNIHQKFLLPSLYFRDIRTADRLASYNCILKQLLGETFSWLVQSASGRK